MFKNKKIKSEGGLKNKPKKNYIIPAFFALIIAMVVFCSLLFIEKRALTDYEQEEVVLCVKDLEAGTKITSSNVDEYFKEVPIPAYLNNNYISDKDDLVGLVNISNIYAGNGASTKVFVKQSELFKANYVEVGLQLSNIDLSVSGDLKSGDFVDIVLTNAYNNTSTLAKNVYVSKTYSSSGEENTKGVIIVNLLIPREYEELFTNALADNTARLIKVNISSDDLKEGKISVFEEGFTLEGKTEEAPLI